MAVDLTIGTSLCRDHKPRCALSVIEILADRLPIATIDEARKHLRICRTSQQCRCIC